MPKSESADTLLKRLQKIERAQARLGDITTRIRAQADTLADLLATAQRFVSDGRTPRAAPKPAGRARSTAPAATATTKRRTAKRPTTPAAATATRAARPAASTATARRAARKTAAV